MNKKIDVEYITNLARIRLQKEEGARFFEQLGEILSYIDKLNEVEMAGTAPTTHPLPLKDVFREDEPRPSLSIDKVLANAPQKRDGFFKVPKVIEEG